MCGIAGVFAFERAAEAAVVEKMTRTMVHRGPDDAGIAVLGARSGQAGPSVALGHRRLSIIDLSERAHQPMTYDDATVVYNGEIYNYLELREELRALGHSFVSDSDTEVLLHAYRQWGDAFLQKLNGIFAFALWDRRQVRLLLARDRFGVKPLYFHEAPGVLTFASEIRAVLAGAGTAPHVNEPLLYDFLLNGRLDHTPETFFAGIRKLGPGCLMLVQNGRSTVHQYWALSLREERAPFAEHVERFRALFTDAVRIQMRSDVPVGACLSGGLDSSSVVSVASRQSPHAMWVFTARYRHHQMDEWRYAQVVHGECPVKPVEVFAEPEEFWANLDEVVKAQEEPFSGPGVFAQWRLMQAIHEAGIKVVLDGQGGDELLCGYAKYVYFQVRDLLRGKRWLRAATTVARAFANGGPQLLNLAGARRYLPRSWWLDRTRLELLQPDFRCRFEERDVVHPGGTVPEQQLLDITRFSFPVLLRYEDKNSMWHSVESRVPFLDHRLVEFAVNLPTDHKIQGGMAKRVLREALKGVLPEKIRRRRSKLGFGGHWHLWVKGLRPQLAGWLERRHLPIDAFVRREALRRQLAADDPALLRALVSDRWLSTLDSMAPA